MSTTDIAVLTESLRGLNTRFDDFVSYSEKINKGQEKIQEETLSQVKKINGSVASLSLRMHDVEYMQENCPAVNLRKEYENSQDEMRFWIFLGKYWKTIALFIGIVIGTYSAITTIASNIREDRVKEVIEVVKPESGVQDAS